MAFGRKTGSLKKLKETLAKGGNGTFIKYVPKNGELNVRFIQEPEEWVSYQEHYDSTLKASFPCSGEKDCPGCVSGERKSSRYLVNAVDLDNKDQVIALQLTKDLTNRLVIRYEKWGTITDRDIELSRTGEGLDTTYDFDAAAPDRKSIAKYKPLDLLDVLQKVYDSVFGEGTDDDDDDEDEKPAVKSRARSAAAPRTSARTRKPAVDEDDDEAEEEEDDEPVEKPATRRRPAPAAARRKIAKPEPDEDEEDDDDEDDEPVAPKRVARRGATKPAPEPEPEEEEDDDEEEVEYDEDDLKAMTLGEVRSIARDAGIVTKGLDQEALIEALMDQPPF